MQRMVYRDNIAILFAVAASIGLHILVLPLVYSHKPPMVHVPPAKATHLETSTELQPEIELGIDKSKESTLTWIGYDEYVEHRARFAEVEQAEMTSVTDSWTTNPATVAIASILRIAEPLTVMATQFLEALQGIKLTTPSRTPSTQSENSTVNLITTDTTETPTPVVEVNPIDAESSDRDSQATSMVRITSEQWKSGKPLAAQGIVLRPRRPSFTANQLVTNVFSDLVAQLHINNQGKPQTVVILYSTGSQSIDRSLESSLYRWRASGEQIEKLEDGKTLSITIHITFSK